MTNFEIVHLACDACGGFEQISEVTTFRYHDKSCTVKPDDMKEIGNDY